MLDSVVEPLPSPKLSRLANRKVSFQRHSLHILPNGAHVSGYPNFSRNNPSARYLGKRESSLLHIK